MRLLVFCLLLLNLLFFVGGQGYLGSVSNPDAFRVQQQLNAERVRVISRDAPPARAEALTPPEPQGAPDTQPEGQAPLQTPQQTPQQTPNDTPAPPVAPAPPPPVTPPVTATATTPAPTPAPTAGRAEPSATQTAAVCLSFNDLNPTMWSRLERALKPYGAELKLSRLAETTGGSFWVFIPPRTNRQEAERKVDELKQLNVPEFFIVQDPPALRFAISLGIFSSREAAEARLASLREQGVRSAKLAARGAISDGIAAELRGRVESLNRFKAQERALLESLKPRACRSVARAS